MAIPSTPLSKSSHSQDFTVRRSFTQPARLSSAATPSPIARSSESDIEILFESQHCKIISFSPQQETGRPRSLSLDPNNASHTDEELPYGSRTERIIAMGGLRVYRVPSSVAFLNSGKLVHAVLPKSACWCVDGKTMFVLSVPGKKYYRVELPCENEADQAKADEFKIVLAKISQYETTRCPFKRGFHVELPESEENTPKRPWRPKHSPGMISPWSPEGQHLVEGVPSERTFLSSIRRTSPTKRTSYLPGDNTSELPVNMSTLSLNSDDTDSIETDVADSIEANVSKVPQLVATYDEFGSGPDIALATPEPKARIWRDNADAVVENRHQSEESVEGLQIPENVLIESVSAADIAEDGDTLQTENTGSGKHVPTEPVLVERDIIEAAHKLLSAESVLTNHQDLAPIQPTGDAEASTWLEEERNDDTPIATRPASGLRPFTAPAFPSLRPETPPSVQIPDIKQYDRSFDEESLASVESTSSFHSLHSPTSPVDFMDGSTISITNRDVSPIRDLKIHKRQRSSKTIKAQTPENTPPLDPSTPKWATFSTVMSEDGEEDDTEADTGSDTGSFTTAASPSLGSTSPVPDRKSRSKSSSSLSKSPSRSLQAHLRRRRTHSPMPAQANIYIPPSNFSGHLTNVILNKTASLLLGPPVQLVALMLNLARRFREGSLSAQTYTYGGRGQPIPCAWGDSDGDIDGNSSEEDDYGISIGGTPEKSHRRKDARRGMLPNDGRWDLD